jgi:hypothetical protein
VELIIEIRYNKNVGSIKERKALKGLLILETAFHINASGIVNDRRK